MLQAARRWWLLVIPAAYLLYFFRLTGAGLLGPDEPRYAAIGREMARSHDWITPRLWGQPWFEKPALLYWMTGAAFRLGLNEDLAPRLPVALVAAGFLAFFYAILRAEFGARCAAFATAILATSAGWLALSHVAVTDIPMSAAFSGAMLLALRWVERGNARWLPATAALLGAAVLAKGLVPLVLALPLAWIGRRRITDLLRLRAAGAFLIVAVPWYLLCYLRNGLIFLDKFLWEHHFRRFSSQLLQHPQPFWFFIPVMLAALFPWLALVLLLFRPSLYSDARRVFLLLWILFGLVFFSLSMNKLPGYILPLLPAVAALLGIALNEARHTRALLSITAILLVVFPVAAQLLPQILAVGLSRSHPPILHPWYLLVAVALAVVMWVLNRENAIALLTLVTTAGVVWLKLQTLPTIDQAASARPIWREIAPVREQVCVERLHRNWRYGLNYYSVTPLPECSEIPKLVRVRQEPGQPPRIASESE